MRSITVKDIHLHPISMPFVEPLKTSFGSEAFKTAIIVEVVTEDGVIGWGESAIKTKPSYDSETMASGLHVCEHFLLPLLIGKTIDYPTHVPKTVKSVRGNRYPKAGIEAAIWDAFAKANDMGLADMFSSYLPAGHESRGYAAVGVSIGIQPTFEETIALIQKRVDQGYNRIKLKIEPGWDVELGAAVRRVFPEIMLMLDANSAYTLEDAAYLTQLDAYDLLMIEQPLGHDDIFEHSKLQPRLTTPVCLDESIKSAHDVRIALELDACRVLNLKPTRVGGYTESLEIYKLCVERELPLWIGGMMETGIARAANIAFASLPGVTLPSDLSATDRYYDPDIAEPPFVLREDSTIQVADGPGIGVEVLRDRLEEAKAHWLEHYPYKDAATQT